ncbi:MAG: hypothetical protein QXU18_03950 [Thermoplasmatales archaeon]
MDRKQMEFELVAKNTFRFQEKSKGEPSMGRLYVQKSIFDSKELEDGEGNSGMRADNNRITFVVHLR